VTADNASRLYGDPNRPFPAQSIGLRNNDNITAAFASAGRRVRSELPDHGHPVDPTGKAGNYVVTFVNGTLTVSPTPLFGDGGRNASRFYVIPNPAFTGTITGI